MIEGFAFAGYRSFHGPLQPVGPMSKVHLVIGQNNSGKSNILRFAQQYFDAIRGAAGLVPPTGLDMPRGTNVSTDFAVAIAFRVPEAFWETVRGAVNHARYKSPAVEALKKVLQHPSLSLTDDSLVWVRSFVTSSRGNRLQPDPSVLGDLVTQTELSELERTAIGMLIHAITGRTNSDEPALFSWLFQNLQPSNLVPPVATIAALRTITAETVDAIDHSGRGLVRALAQLERPDMDHLEDRTKFDSINKFVASVLEDSSARITIPANQDVIHVISSGVELPLENLGTGLHEVIILASAATILDGFLVCIEEPEVHLHPVLQRRLLSYLASNTTNHYLIATHSAHLLDASLASISHVTLNDSRSAVRPAARLNELARVSADLGFRPSDLLQSNAVIWVEGPSDRIYISAWLRRIDESLVEGVHFSVMFYGGKLLSSLSASDQEWDEFIDLRRLNHNLAIVIDSDRRVGGKPLAKTKQRLRREFDGDEVTGFAWITHGYTIENYVPPALLKTAAEASLPSRELSWTGGRYENPLPNSLGKRPYDKVAVARGVVDAWSDQTEMRDDLGRQLHRLAEFVRAANR